MVDVTVAAIEVTSAGYLDQDGIDEHDKALAVVSVESAVVAAWHLAILLLPHLIYQSPESRAVEDSIQVFLRSQRCLRFQALVVVHVHQSALPAGSYAINRGCATTN